MLHGTEWRGVFFSDDDFPWASSVRWILLLLVVTGALLVLVAHEVLLPESSLLRALFATTGVALAGFAMVRVAELKRRSFAFLGYWSQRLAVNEHL